MGGDLNQMRLMFDLLGGDIYRTLALFWIPIFGFYMIVCSRETIIYLNNCSVARLSFDRCTSNLHKYDLSTYYINWPFRKANMYYDFLIG